MPKAFHPWIFPDEKYLNSLPEGADADRAAWRAEAAALAEAAHNRLAADGAEAGDL